MMTHLEKGSPLVGSRCPRCYHVDFPPLPACSACSFNGEREMIEFGPIGILYTFTIVHVATEAQNAPYAIGYVDFPEGVRAFGRISSARQLRAQMKVQAYQCHDGSCRFEPVKD